jgi:hypothetical protein
MPLVIHDLQSPGPKDCSISRRLDWPDCPLQQEDKQPKVRERENDQNAFHHDFLHRSMLGGR